MAIVIIGQGQYQQSAPERWQASMWDLDRLVVPFRGAEVNRRAFIAQFSNFEPSDLDGDMFLDEVVNMDDSKNFPTVQAIYQGKRGGVLPPDKKIQQRSIQQVRYLSYAIPGDPATGYKQPPVITGPLASAIGTFTLDVTYAALAKGIISWARDDSELDVGDLGDSINFNGEIYIDRAVATWENWSADHFDVDSLAGITETDEDGSGLFFLDTIISGDIEEVVSEQYFKATAMVNSILFPDPPDRPSG